MPHAQRFLFSKRREEIKHRRVSPQTPMSPMCSQNWWPLEHLLLLQWFLKGSVSQEWQTMSTVVPGLVAACTYKQVHHSLQVYLCPVHHTSGQTNQWNCSRCRKVHRKVDTKGVFFSFCLCVNFLFKFTKSDRFTLLAEFRFWVNAHYECQLNQVFPRTAALFVV